MRRPLRHFLLLGVLIAVACGGETRDTGQNSTATESRDEVLATASGSPDAEEVASPVATDDVQRTATSDATVAGQTYEYVGTIGEPAPLVAPLDVAVGPDGSLYAADIERSAVVVISGDGHVVAEWKVEGLPWAISVAPDGRIYIPDGRNPAVLQVFAADGSPLDAIQFVEGDERPDIDLTDLAVDSSGYVYAVSGVPGGTMVSPAMFSGVVVLAPDGGEVARWEAPSSIQPRAVAVGPDDTIYVGFSSGGTEGGIARFRRDEFDPAGWTDGAIGLEEVGPPGGIAVGSDGQLFVIGESAINEPDAPPTNVYILSPSGEGLGTWEVPKFGGRIVSGATGIVVGSDGVYLADALHHRIVHLNHQGQIIGGLGEPQPGQLGEPTDIEVGADGNVYVADSAFDLIHVLSPDGALIRGVTIPDETIWFGSLGHAIGVDSDGRLYVSYSIPPKIVVLSPDGAVVDDWSEPMTPIPGGQPELFHPGSIAVGDDVVYVGMFQDPLLKYYTPDGTLIDRWPLPGEANRVWSVVVAAGTPYALVSVGSPPYGDAESRVLRLAPAGTNEVVATVPRGEDSSGMSEFLAAALAVDGEGAIYLADPFRHEVRKLDAVGTEVARWTIDVREAAPVGAWLTIAAGEDGRLYVADGYSQQVSVYAPGD